MKRDLAEAQDCLGYGAVGRSSQRNCCDIDSGQGDFNLQDFHHWGP